MKTVITPILNLFTFLGDLNLMLFNIVRLSFVPPFYFRKTLQQMHFICVGSIPIVSAAIFFGAMAVALQSLLTIENFGYKDMAANLLGTSLITSLGSVMACMVATGRVCSSMSAEISSMKITEQLDALKTVNVNLYKYLYAPKFWSCILGFPVIAAFASLAGLLGGDIIIVFVGHVSPMAFYGTIFEYVTGADIIVSALKTFIIGGINALVALFFATRAVGGAKGVALATLKAVTAAFILTMVADNIVTMIYVGLFK